MQYDVQDTFTIHQEAEEKRGSLYYRVGKRAIDTSLIITLSPVLIPLMGIVALLIMSDGGSPIFSQNRLGKGWRTFRIFKFRTMKKGAEEMLRAHLLANPEAREEWDKFQKLKDDPRITPMGRFLRKTSIDELPQLFNVLTGEMSLVGPRPMLPEQKALYPGVAYQDLKPGLTGPWQVMGRKDTTIENRAKYDDSYQSQVGLKSDVGMIFRTFGVIVKCTGS